MNKPCRFISLSIAAVDVPASADGMHPTASHLAAMAMLVAERGDDTAWRFDLEAHAIAAGESEDELLRWAVATMPESGVVLGWQLAERIVPPLLDAGTIGDPEIGQAFLDRLMRLVTEPSIDLAVPHGGAGAPALDVIAARRGIALVPMAVAAIESAWAVGDLQQLRGHVEAHAIATWQLWLAESNGTAAVASEASASWLERRAKTAA